MKSVFLHIIIVFTALNVVTLNQLTKTPLLIIHYIDHLQRNDNISFGDFIQMHYFENDTNDNDDQQDKQLPLKDFDLNYTIVIALPPDFLNFNSLPLIFKSESTFPLCRAKRLASTFISGTYRPPRILA